MLYIVITVSIIIIAVSVLLYQRSLRKSRATVIQELGASLDLAFLNKDNSILENLKFFKIYDATTLQASASNVLRSKTRPPDIWIFDYRAIIGLKTASARIEHTVFYFSDPRMKLPGFRILPKNSAIGRQSDAVFKHRPILFPSHPLFTANYRLIGPEENEIKDLFKPDLIAYFEKLKGVCVEGFGNEVIMYQHKTLIPQRLFSRFYHNAQSIFQLFLHHSAIFQAEKTGLTVYT